MSMNENMLLVAAAVFAVFLVASFFIARRSARNRLEQRTRWRPVEPGEALPPVGEARRTQEVIPAEETAGTEAAGGPEALRQQAGRSAEDEARRVAELQATEQAERQAAALPGFEMRTAVRKQMAQTGVASLDQPAASRVPPCALERCPPLMRACAVAVGFGKPCQASQDGGSSVAG